MGDGEIRKALGPKAQLAALERDARKAGRDYADDAWRAYLAQCRVDFDAVMWPAGEAFESWLWSANVIPPADGRIEQRLKRAFIEAWDAAVEH